MPNRNIPSVIAVCVVVNSIIDHTIDLPECSKWDQKQVLQLVYTGFSVHLRSSILLFSSINKCVIKAVHFRYGYEVCAGRGRSFRAYWTRVDYRCDDYNVLVNISELYIGGDIFLTRKIMIHVNDRLCKLFGWF